MNEVLVKKSSKELLCELNDKISELENVLHLKLGESDNSANAVEFDSYEEIIGNLTVENSDLEHKLKRKEKEYEELKKVATEIGRVLKSSITSIRIFLKGNE